jgi:hypothetical protein
MTVAMSDRRLSVFFYGLFMDPEILISKGIQPTEIRIASLKNFALRIGQRATLVPEETGMVHGVVMSLLHDELEKLYSEPSVRAYRPEPVLAELSDGEVIASLCFNLVEPPSNDEHNAEYATKLREVAKRVGLPAEYVASIR